VRDYAGREGGREGGRGGGREGRVGTRPQFILIFCLTAESGRPNISLPFFFFFIFTFYRWCWKRQGKATTRPWSTRSPAKPRRTCKETWSGSKPGWSNGRYVLGVGLLPHYLFIHSSPARLPPIPPTLPSFLPLSFLTIYFPSLFFPSLFTGGLRGPSERANRNGGVKQ
jgi:hypothetical protein